MIRTTVSFPPELWDAIKRLAAVKNRSCGDIIRQHCASIPSELAKLEKPKTPENLGPAVATEFERFAQIVAKSERSLADTLRQVSTHLESKLTA